MDFQEKLAIKHNEGYHENFPHIGCEMCFPVNKLMVSKPSRIITGEERIRHYIRNGIHYKVSISWHVVDGGRRYYYIHVYRGGKNLPFRWMRWWTDAEGNFLSWG